MSVTIKVSTRKHCNIIDEHCKFQNSTKIKQLKLIIFWKLPLRRLYRDHGHLKAAYRLCLLMITVVKQWNKLLHQIFSPLVNDIDNGNHIPTSQSLRSRISLGHNLQPIIKTEFSKSNYDFHHVSRLKDQSPSLCLTLIGPRTDRGLMCTCVRFRRTGGGLYPKDERWRLVWL